jgi:N-acyl-D-aspartate/D-glutamate deacylase
MLTYPLTVMEGSDAGAHMRFICDVSAHTFLLTNWVRDCVTGDRDHLPLEFVVKKQTRDTARLFGMSGRGTLEPGRKADLNLIDLNALSGETLAIVYDVPAGMPRLMQTAQGDVATVVSGEVVQENGAATGARPGQMVRDTEDKFPATKTRCSGVSA